MGEIDVRNYMTFDHQETDDLITGIINSRGKIDLKAASRIGEMLRRHIFIEETILFPVLPQKLADDVEYLEQEHGRVFRILRQISLEEDENIARELYSDLLQMLLEHNSYEESYIYDSYQSLTADSIGGISGPDENWECAREAP